MTFPLSSNENRATWIQVRKWINEFPDREHWNRRRAIVRSPSSTAPCLIQFDTLFRAGQSVSHLILSTIDHHGLHHEPRVTVDVTPEW